MTPRSHALDERLLGRLQPARSKVGLPQAPEVHHGSPHVSKVTASRQPPGVEIDGILGTMLLGRDHGLDPEVPGHRIVLVQLLERAVRLVEQLRRGAGISRQERAVRPPVPQPGGEEGVMRGIGRGYGRFSAGGHLLHRAQVGKRYRQALNGHGVCGQIRRITQSLLSGPRDDFAGLRLANTRQKPGLRGTGKGPQLDDVFPVGALAEGVERLTEQADRGGIPTARLVEVIEPLNERAGRGRIASSQVMAPGRSHVVEVLLDHPQRARLVAPGEQRKALLHERGVKRRVCLVHMLAEFGIAPQLRLGVLAQQLVQRIAPGLGTRRDQRLVDQDRQAAQRRSRDCLRRLTAEAAPEDR